MTAKRRTRQSVGSPSSPTRRDVPTDGGRRSARPIPVGDPDPRQLGEQDPSEVDGEVDDGPLSVELEAWLWFG